MPGMANPYLANYPAPIPDLREAPYGGTVGAVNTVNTAATVNAPPAQPDWISSNGPKMCEMFKTFGSGMGADPYFKGSIEDARANFDSFWSTYEIPSNPPAGEEGGIKDFAWGCFVEGFESGRAKLPRVESNDDGWGLLTWMLVLGGAGAAGLFGYNYLKTT